MLRLMGRTLARQDSNSSLPAAPENRQKSTPFLAFKSFKLIHHQLKRTSSFVFVKFPCSGNDATNTDSLIPCEESGIRNEKVQRFAFS